MSPAPSPSLPPPEQAPARYRLLLLGPPRLLDGDEAVRLPYQKAMALLAYLATQPDTCSRERLAAMFWEESDEARAAANLRHALHTLRSSMPEGILLEADQVGLERRQVWIDVDVLRGAEGLESLEAATRLRRGPFCEGVLIRDSLGFDDWLSLQRQEFDAISLGLLVSLSRARADVGEYEKAVEALREALRIDRLHEPAHALLVRLLVDHGEPAAAARHLEECRRIFMEELGVPLSPELSSLLQSASVTPVLSQAPGELMGPPAEARVQADIEEATPATDAGEPGPASEADAPAADAETVVEGRERILGPLPTALADHFHGRLEERAFLREQVGRPDVRLVTIMGRAGVGKTALITRFIHDVCEEPGGAGVDLVFYLSARGPEIEGLDPLVDLVCRTLEHAQAEEVRVRWRGADSLWTRLDYLLRHCLAGLRCLLVLDDCQDLLGPDDEIAASRESVQQLLVAVLSWDHDVTLVMASRASILLSPELEGSLGRRRVELALERGLDEADAVALLRDLDFDDTVGVHGAKADLLRRLARACHCTPRLLEAVVGTLRQRSTLTLGRLLEEGTTLGRLVDGWSRDFLLSLPDGARRVMQALAVLGRPVPLAALQQVVVEGAVEEGLEALVRRHGACSERARFWLSPPDQDYVLRTLAENDGAYARSLHEGAARWFMGQRLEATRWRRWKDLEAHLEAFRHFCEAGFAEQACDLLDEIDPDLFLRWGHVDDVVAMRRSLVDRLDDARRREANSALLGQALSRAGQADAGIPLLKSAVRMARGRKDIAARARWMGLLGEAVGDTGDLLETIGYFEQAVELARRAGDPTLQSRLLGQLGDAHLSLGSMERALEYASSALDMARQEGNRWLEGVWEGILGVARGFRGQLQAATIHFEWALRLARDEGDRGLEAEWRTYLGNASVNLGAYDDATVHFRGALEILRAFKRARFECFALDGLGDVACLRGDLVGAREFYSQALAAARGAVDRVVMVHPLRGLGLVNHLEGRLDEAETHYLEGLALNRPLSGYRFSVKLALLEMARGRPKRAQQRWEEAVNSCNVLLERTPDLYWARYHLALADLGGRRFPEAQKAYARAIEACGAPGVRARAFQLLGLLEGAGAIDKRRLAGFRSLLVPGRPRQ